VALYSSTVLGRSMKTHCKSPWVSTSQDGESCLLVLNNMSEERHEGKKGEQRMYVTMWQDGKDIWKLAVPDGTIRHVLVTIKSNARCHQYTQASCGLQGHVKVNTNNSAVVWHNWWAIQNSSNITWIFSVVRLCLWQQISKWYCNDIIISQYMQYGMQIMQQHLKLWPDNKVWVFFEQMASWVSACEHIAN